MYFFLDFFFSLESRALLIGVLIFLFSEVEKLYPPASRMPYVCNATTSKNDSAVSSTFSSAANNQNAVLKLSTIREEQIRDNPTTLTLAVCIFLIFLIEFVVSRLCLL